LQYDYPFSGAVEKVLHQLNARVLSQDFSEHVLCTIEVHRDVVAPACKRFKDACSGRIRIELDKALLR
jgi:putative IMPACT (imprinted ancient) family translation regulator